MGDDLWLKAGVGLAVFGLSGLGFLGFLRLYAVMQAWRRRRLARPNWSVMLADTKYFEGAMVRIFHAQGYRVDKSWALRDPIERQEREVVLALARRGEPYAALCGRWVIPITSEIVTRFEKALAQTRASRGLIVTTSYFTPAAMERAQAYEVEMVDGATLQKWIEEIW